ncbi:MAG: DUF3199 family protein [Blautia sp.]|nr:DUF3199 family protein [Blautia sp.]
MQRPWISPDDVKEYTDYPEVAERSEGKLKQDILRAEMKIIKITNNRFDDDEKYTEIPEQVKLATILVAEAYAKNLVERATKKIKSETFDDYSYELTETKDIDISGLDLDELLADFVIQSRGNMHFRMTAI